VNHSARRINSLAKQLGARRYLEVGVSAGATFRDVEIAERTGVDPNFLFDTNTLANEFTRLVRSTSDEFFVTEPLFPPYDVIFIDGLHKFEQVVRDLSNALIRTHRHSVIILDDTIAGDVYSAIPDQEAALRYRRAAGIGSSAWNGDVFKTVFYIHDFWPSLNYRTIGGSPQTLVWRGNGMRRPPLFDDLERISRLTYFDLQENYGVLQLATEEEAIALCAAEVNIL